MTFSFLVYYLCTCIVSTCILIQLLAATQNKSLIWIVDPYMQVGLSGAAHAYECDCESSLKVG